MILIVALAGSVYFFWSKRQAPPTPTPPVAQEKVHHWEYVSKYAVLRMSAPGDSAILFRGVDTLATWIKDFTSKYKYDGELDQKVFNAKLGDTIPLDEEAYDLFSFALKFREFSHGDIDVGIGNLLRAWKIGWDQESRVPTVAERKAFVKDLQTPFYSLDSIRKSMIILKPAHHFALGAFMEGNILNHMANQLEKAGAKSWLVEISGDFAYRGIKPNGEPWVLGVKDPANPDDLLAVARMQPDKHSFCTSGDYEQQFKDSKGKSHHHIIDPHTGESTVGKHSATVSTSIPWMNKNTLCTWFMILPFEDIKKVVAESNGQIETMLVLDSNRVWISPGLRNNIKMINPEYHVIE